MKHRNLIIVLSLLLVHTGFAQNKLSNLFSTLDGMEKMTQVTITKSMLHMMPDLGSSVEMNGMNIEKIITGLDRIDIFTAEDVFVQKKMAEKITEFFAGNKAYEVLIKIKDEKDNVVFYGKNDGNLFSSLVMFVDSADDCVLIHLSGAFTTQDIQNITKPATK